MRYRFLVLPLAALLGGCGNDDTTTTSTPPVTGVAITGLDANSEYNALAARLQQAALPRAGETKTSVALETYKTDEATCRYSVTTSYAISNVTADSFDETVDRNFVHDSGPFSCPTVPPGQTAGHFTRTLRAADYVAEKLRAFQRYFDVRGRAQRESWITEIGITSSELTTSTISYQVVPVQRITIDLAGKLGVKVRETFEISTDSWFLGEVSYTIHYGNGTSLEAYRVDSYQP